MYLYSLPDNTERQAASELLEDFKRTKLYEIIGQDKVELTVDGLEIMNDDPSKTFFHVHEQSQD